MLIAVFLFLAVCFLAYSNGANDNFKGVATLYGSGTTTYNVAIGWATVTTALGSVASIFMAETLVRNFSGKGLVPDMVAASPEFLLAVAVGAGVTVLLAALLGFPISTTHGLIGALVGAGVVLVGPDVNYGVLGNVFILPLLVSPIVAIVLGGASYLVLRGSRRRLGIRRDWCVCAGESAPGTAVVAAGAPLALRTLPTIDVTVAPTAECQAKYTGDVLGIGSQKLLDVAHFMSAGVVSFARGLNDTPKIVGLLMGIKLLGVQSSLLAVALAIAMGGLLSARRVADTVSRKITSLSHGQGLTANLVTGVLVVFASHLGMPVSTTHVSVGSLFGIGMITRQANQRIIAEILTAWVLTLPVAAVAAGTVMWLLKPI